MVSSINPVSHQPRFGWGAGADDVKVIQTAAQKTWQVKTVDSKLCFSRSDSRFGVWNTIKGFFSNLVDGLKLRWQMYRKGYGMFAGYIPEPTDVFRLYRFTSPEKATEAEKKFQQTATYLRSIKKTVQEKLAAYRQTIQTSQNAHGKVDTSDLAIPDEWINPFPSLVLFQTPKSKSRNGKDPWLQEHYLSTSQVAKVDDKTLLVRVRLGPHP